MEPFVSCFYLSYIVWNMSENFQYEAVYFKG